MVLMVLEVVLVAPGDGPEGGSAGPGLFETLVSRKAFVIKGEGAHGLRQGGLYPLRPHNIFLNAYWLK